MFSSRDFITDVNIIPANWIFENYLGLPEPMTGQSVKLKSLFNPNDKTPSMYLYYNTKANTYRYKCFSTGMEGSAVSLMMYIWNVNFVEASHRIIKDYVDYVKSGRICETRIIQHSRWQVASYKTRQWSKDDAAFWSSYNISSKMLESFKVVPIERYTMHKTTSDNNDDENFEIISKHIYGYFTKEDVLYKIYQPMNRERKFIKLCDYIQGYDQLQNKPYLIIASSLKDCLAIKSMNLDADVIAPNSENTILSEDLIIEFKQVYEGIVTVFDSDLAGIKAMQTYKSKYRLPFVYLPLEKDIADIVKIHGVQRAMIELVPKLCKAYEEYDLLQES
jgi:hypothetical protein